MAVNYWLMKSEPSAYSWSQLEREKRSSWNGVRNYQANNNMKAMKVGDKAFFYHSNDERSIVGIMKIISPWHLDPEDERRIFGMVTVEPITPLMSSVSLAEIKSHPRLSEMVFVRQSRLSIAPVTKNEWETIMDLSKST